MLVVVVPKPRRESRDSPRYATRRPAPTCCLHGSTPLRSTPRCPANFLSCLALPTLAHCLTRRTPAPAPTRARTNARTRARAAMDSLRLRPSSLLSAPASAAARRRGECFGGFFSSPCTPSACSRAMGVLLLAISAFQ